MTVRDFVDDEEQDAGDSEGPCCADCSGGELVAHLLPLLVPPPSSIGRAGLAIESWDERGGEESGEDITNISADTVESEDVKTLVDGDKVLVAGGEETCRRCQSADESRDIDGNWS